VKIFISSTSGDLAPTRQRVVAWLRNLGHGVVEEQTFPFTGGQLVEKIKICLHEADAVLHLVGPRWGGDSGVEGCRWSLDEEEEGPLSYTQLEAVLAEELHMPVVAVILGDDFPYREAPPESEDLRARQQSYRASLLVLRREIARCATMKELEIAVQRIEWDGILHTGFEVRKYQDAVLARVARVELSTIADSPGQEREHVAVLDEIFVPPEAEDANLELFSENLRHHALSSSNKPERKSVEALVEAREQYPRVVLMGDAGAGKSTLFKWLMLRWARLPLDQARVSAMPVLIHLGDFAASGQRLTDEDSLLEFAAARFFAEQQRQLRPAEQARLFARLLREKKAWLLLDALDEIFSPEKRAAVASTITAVIRRIPEGSIWISTREAGYLRTSHSARHILAEKTNSRPLFEHWRILAFDDRRIDRFLTGWFRTRATPKHADKDPGERSARLRELLRRRPKVEELARAPLLLTLLAILSEQSGELPTTRYQIFAECAELFLDRWLFANNDASQTRAKARDSIEENRHFQGIRLDKDMLRYLLRRAAWHMQNRPEGEDGAAVNLIRGEQLKEVFKAGIASWEEKSHAGKYAAAADELVALFDERASMLHRQSDILPASGDVVTFIHRGFLEFFAAEVVLASLRGQPEPDMPGKISLSEYRDTVLWRERLNYYAESGDHPALVEDAENPPFEPRYFASDGRIVPSPHWELDPAWEEIKYLSFSQLSDADADAVLAMLLRARNRRPLMWTVYLAARLLAEWSPEQRERPSAATCKNALLDCAIQTKWAARISNLKLLLGVATPLVLGFVLATKVPLPWWGTTPLVIIAIAAGWLAALFIAMSCDEQPGWWTLDFHRRLEFPNIGTRHDYQQALLDRLNWKHDPMILQGLVQRSCSRKCVPGRDGKSMEIGGKTLTAEQLADLGAGIRVGQERAFHFVRHALKSLSPSDALRAPLLTWIGEAAAGRGDRGGQISLLLLLLQEIEQEKGDKKAALEEVINRHPTVVSLLRYVMSHAPQ